MIKQTRLLRSRFWVATCLSLAASQPPLWANPPQANPARVPSILFNAPPPPTDQGAPRGRSQGGASRGNCEQYQGLRAIVPSSEGQVWGLTASEHPSVWVYLPSALTAEVTLEFVLQDAADREIYLQQFTPADKQPGLIRLSVPETAPAIEPDKPYFWTLAIYCNLARPSDSVFVQGTVQRANLTPDQQRQLETATPLEQSRLYAELGFWYDALTTLAELRQTDPTEAEAVWSDLLQQAGLEAVADQPISSCCTP